jgi:hypothetical protein
MVLLSDCTQHSRLTGNKVSHVSKAVISLPLSQNPAKGLYPIPVFHNHNPFIDMFQIQTLFDGAWSFEM